MHLPIASLFPNSRWLAHPFCFSDWQIASKLITTSSTVSTGFSCLRSFRFKEGQHSLPFQVGFQSQRCKKNHLKIIHALENYVQGSGGCIFILLFLFGFSGCDRCVFNPLEVEWMGFFLVCSRALNLGCYNHEHSGTETVEITLVSNLSLLAGIDWGCVILRGFLVELITTWITSSCKRSYFRMWYCRESTSEGGFSIFCILGFNIFLET